MTEVSATILELNFLKVIRILLLKIVNQSIKNINNIFENNNWNLTRSLGGRHCPRYSVVGYTHIFSIFIINSHSVY